MARLWALLLLAACLPLSAAYVLDPSSLDLGGGTINICTSEYTPIAYCEDRDPSQYSGYEIELFERVRRQLGWANDRLNWSCVDWYTMTDSLAAGDGVCDIGVAGVDVSVDYLYQGIMFTFPTLSLGGYRILVPAEESVPETWAFMDAFTAELWVAIVCTMVVVGCIIWGVERWANIRPPPPGMPPPPALEKQVWTSLGRPMQTTDMVSRNTAGNLIVVVYGFMMLILVTLLTANTAANLTATRLQSNIRSVEDLPGKTVGTWDDTSYINDLLKRGIKAKGYRWDNVEDERRMFDAVAKREVDALVLDSYVLDFHAASRCDVRVVGDVWEQYDQALAFSSVFEDSPIIKKFNEILVQLKESGDMENLVNNFVKPPEASCKSRGVSETTTKVSFKEVAGLWILLAASVGVALVLVIISQLIRRGALRVVRTKTYQSSLRRIQTLRAAQKTKSSSGSGQGGWLPQTGHGSGSAAADAGLQGGGIQQTDLEGRRQDSALAENPAGSEGQGTNRVGWSLPPAPPGYPPLPPPQTAAAQHDVTQLSSRLEDVLLRMEELLQARGPMTA